MVLQTGFTVWMCDYQKAWALESRYYSPWTTAFSRFLRNVCFGNREDHCFSTPLYSTTFPSQWNLKYDPGRFDFRILLHVPCWEACAGYSSTCEALQGQNLDRSDLWRRPLAQPRFSSVESRRYRRIEQERPVVPHQLAQQLVIRISVFLWGFFHLRPARKSCAPLPVQVKIFKESSWCLSCFFF